MPPQPILIPSPISGRRRDALDPVPRVEGRARPLRGHHQHEPGQRVRPGARGNFEIRVEYLQS